MRCSDCIHFKDRYVLFMDGGYINLQELLDKGLIHSNDFLCEGYGCIFQPCQNFTLDKATENMMGVPFEDLDNDMEIKCEMFEARKNFKELILVKNANLSKILTKKRERHKNYFIFQK